MKLLNQFFYIFSLQTVEELKEQLLVQRQKLADKLCTIQELEEKFNAKSRDNDRACQTIQLLLIKTRDLDAKLEETKSKEVSHHQHLSST